MFDRALERAAAVLTRLGLQQRQAAQQNGRRRALCEQSLLGVLSGGLLHRLEEQRDKVHRLGQSVS